jgi:hypothetical protein
VADAELCPGLMPALASSASSLIPDGRRTLWTMSAPLEEERELFDLEPVQRMARTEAAEVRCVSSALEKRRLNRCLRPWRSNRPGSA